MAALDAAALDDSPAGAGAHPVTEAVLALTASYIGLISAFHNGKSRSGGSRSALGYEPLGRIVKEDGVLAPPVIPTGSAIREKLPLPAKERTLAILRNQPASGLIAAHSRHQQIIWPTRLFSVLPLAGNRAVGPDLPFLNPGEGVPYTRSAGRVIGWQLPRGFFER